MKSRQHVILLIAMLLALAPAQNASAQTASCGGESPAWIACETDSDCVVGENMCGFPRGYNGNYLDAVNAYNKCMGPMISCAMPPQKDDSLRAVCIKNTCQLAPK